ncbi:serine hydrolase [Apilactobacillus timberlakei]|uniref:Beta-lactamase class A catalytic domain-containing protein n=1 Tax=Apilactobacillus timberlakei TaxID=2008380 RepID=A0ABY2YR80_9LACO|nr:serine hydrolase [Apilactobacillus timberlakei]TPR12309.1 hypothetical protein DY048_07890 [Apilactobacillus timberlakei]TPR12912.1 hypothetical protein DY052_08995 [Apilactobacillus timberlakei]
MINNIFKTLVNNKKISVNYIKHIVVKKANNLLAYQLTDIINALIDSNCDFILNYDYITIIYKKMTFYLTIKLTDDGLIKRIKINPIIPKLSSIYDLKNIFSNLFLEYGILSTGILNYDYKSQSKFAIASLIKLKVACSIYKMLNDEILKLNDIYIIKKEDLSCLSSGLSIDNVNKKITIKELISRLLLASDNTAMDILLKIICKKNFEKNFIVPTKIMYKKSWGVNFFNQNKKMEYVMTHSVWNKGLDYFLSLNQISSLLDYLSKQTWLPWDNVNCRKLIYKGGSSTGILSSAWLRNDQFNSKFLFVINSKRNINILEEIYIYECVNSILKDNKFL